MPRIQSIQAKEILDGRGLPTIEATLWLDSGFSVETSVPSGTSIGKYESVELRDNAPSRLLGLGVLKAVDNVNNIINPALVGQDPTQQQEIDQLLQSLDGTPNKAKLGANAILAASQAVLKAGALSSGLSLYQYLHQKYQLNEGLFMPTCLFSIVNGGEHGADNLDIQEFMIIPATSMDYPSSLDMAVIFQKKLEEILVLKGAIHSTGLLGGFTPNLYNNTDVFEILVETIKTTPYTFAQDIFFGIDATGSSFYTNGKYKLRDRAQGYASKELVEFYKNIRDVYKVTYIEDPFDETDVSSWASLTEVLGQTTRIVGDDIIASNQQRMNEAMTSKLCNTVVIKPNQIGTISETVEIIRQARQAGWQVVVSHRSGDTTDDFIADFAVGVGADFAKFGPANRGERVVKYNRLSEINQELLNAPENQASVPVATPATTPAAAPATSNPAPNPTV